jgi:hypothetical protein
MQLGAFGLLLGVIGLTISPVILFGALLKTVIRAWNE